jgi:CSLREA domain-containing protein
MPLLLLVLAAEPAAAVVHIFTVNTTADGTDANPGNGVCETAPGNHVCTVRAAIMEANHTISGVTIIEIPANPNPYVLTIPPSGNDDESTGDLWITRDTSIVGDGAAVSILDGGGIDDVLVVFQPNTVDIEGLTIRNGNHGPYSAGAILNTGHLTLTACVVKGSSGADGGGIFSNGGSLVLDRCTVSGNTANGTGGTGTGRGGGVYVNSGTAAFVNTTISGNTALRLGGGLIAGNTASCTLSMSTVTDNIAESNTGTGGGVLQYSSSTISFTGTIIAGNFEVFPTQPLPTLVDGDCAGTLSNGGSNIVGTKTNCSIAGPVTVADPNLGPLQVNGGSVPTHALHSPSPAIDGLALSACQDPYSGYVDVRGAHRPAGVACDIGAYEFNANGDVNGDGARTVADVFYVINFLFAGGAAPNGLGDVNGDGVTNVQDVFSLINFLFAGGPAPL